MQQQNRKQNISIYRKYATDIFFKDEWVDCARTSCVSVRESPSRWGELIFSTRDVLLDAQKSILFRTS